MKHHTRLMNRIVRPAAACALVALAAYTLTASGAAVKDRYELAREIANGDAGTPALSGSLVHKPNPNASDTIVPNTPHWSLPPARAGHESPLAKTPRLVKIPVRPTILAPEQPLDTAGETPYPSIQPETPLAWDPFPRPSELSVPAVLSGPDGQRAKLSSNPTAIQSRQAVLVKGALLRDQPAGFLRLRIPDPFGVVDEIRLDLRTMPADDDPPSSPVTPPDPTMPITTSRRR